MQKFSGRSICKLDSKGRLMIPAKFRRIIPAEVAEILYISKGKDECLNLYPTGEWDVLLERLDKLDPGRKKRDLIRFYSDTSQPLNVDKAGRVAIPSEFIEMIGNPKKVVVIGALKYMEIWNAENYEEIRRQAAETYHESDWEG